MAVNDNLASLALSLSTKPKKTPQLQQQKRKKITENRWENCIKIVKGSDGREQHNNLIWICKDKVKV